MTVSTNEVMALAIVAVIVVIYSFSFYKKILLINIDGDLAKIEKIKIKLINISFLTLKTWLFKVDGKPFISVYIFTFSLLLFSLATLYTPWNGCDTHICEPSSTDTYLEDWVKSGNRFESSN